MEKSYGSGMTTTSIIAAAIEGHYDVMLSNGKTRRYDNYHEHLRCSKPCRPHGEPYCGVIDTVFRIPSSCVVGCENPACLAGLDWESGEWDRFFISPLHPEDEPCSCG